MFNAATVALLGAFALVDAILCLAAGIGFLLLPGIIQGREHDRQ